MPYGKGKFEGQPASTFILYDNSLDQGFDEEYSNYDTWWALYKGQILPSLKRTEAAKLAGYTEQEIQESVVALSEMVGAILKEDSQGFVTASIYLETSGIEAEILMADWLEITKEETLFIDESVSEVMFSGKSIEVKGEVFQGEDE